ncbi:MAG: metallophosphoesterase family protein [Victivallales bacterium]
MIRKLYIFTAVLLIVAGCGILSIQYCIFSGLTDHITPVLPPAGLALHPERKSFSVAVFSDFASRVDSVEKIGREISRSRAAFVLCLGDMVRKRTHPDFLHVAKELRECIVQPFYAVPGNWDRNDSSLWDVYRTHFGQDYYFFSYGDTLFVGLNTADGSLPEDQQEFLRRTLQRERGHFARCVIFCHVPPEDPRERGDHAMDPVSAGIFRDIIQPYRVDLILCGHIHRFSESDFEGTRLVIAPSSGQSIRDPDNRMFGYLLLDFPADGTIRVHRMDVTPETGFEELDYFFTVDLCRPGWFASAVAAIAAGLFLLLWQNVFFRFFHRTGGR